MDEEDKAYRNQLVEYEQKIGESYDKLILSLSGGALGISVIFIKDVIRNPVIDIQLAAASWLCWIASLLCILFSLNCGMWAYRRAIKGLDNDNIDNQNPGGFFGAMISYLNIAGGVFFLAGLICFIYFAYLNIGEKNEQRSEIIKTSSQTNTNTTNTISPTTANATFKTKR